MVLNLSIICRVQLKQHENQPMDDFLKQVANFKFGNRRNVLENQTGTVSLSNFMNVSRSYLSITRTIVSYNTYCRLLLSPGSVIIQKMGGGMVFLISNFVLSSLFPLNVLSGRTKVLRWFNCQMLLLTWTGLFFYKSQGLENIYLQKYVFIYFFKVISWSWIFFRLNIMALSTLGVLDRNLGSSLILVPRTFGCHLRHAVG